MIVWINSEATGRPNDQRAEIERIEDVPGLRLHVRMLGDDAHLTVRLKDVCKVELDTGSDKLLVTASVAFGGYKVQKTTCEQRLRPEESDEFRKQRFCLLAEYFLRGQNDRHEREAVILDGIYAVPDSLVPVDASLRHEAHGLTLYFICLANNQRSEYHLSNQLRLRAWADAWWEQHGV